MSPAQLLDREPRYAPLTDHDTAALSVADWLDTEGYINAAEVIRAVIQPFETVSLIELKDRRDVRDALLAASDLKVYIWSTEWRSYWRANGAGYTPSRLNAGVYTMVDAWNRSSHCDSSKGICYEIVDAPPRQSGWKS